MTGHRWVDGQGPGRGSDNGDHGGDDEGKRDKAPINEN